MTEPQFKDSLFRGYFKDKFRLMSLINALLGMNLTDADELEINTIDGLYSTDIRNDISCVFRDKFLVLIEQQSTANPNMPTRFLFYLTELMKKLIDDAKAVHRPKLIKFPKPEFVVLYNGRRSGGQQTEMRLSDAFGGANNIELVAKFVDVREGHNEDVIRRSRELYNYCTFVNRVEHNRRVGMKINDALREAMDHCIANDIMADYLRAHYMEVAKVYVLEYDREAEQKAYYKIGREEGLELGREEGAIKMIKSFFRAGTPLSVIEQATGWTEAQIKEVLADEVKDEPN